MSPADPPVSDAELISRHVAGQADAFGELVRRHQDRLWAVALRTLGDEEEAADALQDALVSAFRRAEAFRGDAAVTTWLHRIVVNACIDRTRRRTARPTVPLSEATEVYAATGDPDPAVAWEEARDVTAALAKLPAEQRCALILVDMEGYSIDEAARVLDVASGTVKSRCARGRARLAPMVAHMRPGPSRDAGNQSASSGVPSTRDGDQGGASRS